MIALHLNKKGGQSMATFMPGAKEAAISRFYAAKNFMAANDKVNSLVGRWGSE